MTYFELYKFLTRKPYRYNSRYHRLEDFSTLRAYQRFTRPIHIDLVGKPESYIEFAGTRDLQSFFQNRYNLRSQMSYTEAKSQYPEFFI